jgi:hypothetical protein
MGGADGPRNTPCSTGPPKNFKKIKIKANIF